MIAKPLRMEVRIEPNGRELPNSFDIYWGFRKFVDEYFQSRFPTLQGVKCYVEVILVESTKGRTPAKFEETYQSEEEYLLS